MLLSDGIETCNRDPCATAERLERTGVDFTAHVVGFDVERERDRAQLRCLAENTGGRFLSAASAGELRSALTRVADAAVEPAPIPPSPDVEVTVPEEVTVGTRFDVDWTPSVTEDDFVTIVPTDAGEREIRTHWRVGNGSPGELRAPQNPGAYEVRYVRNRGKKMLGRAAIQVVDAEVSLEAPEEVTVGTPIEVQFDRTIAPADYLTVVRADAPEGTVGEHVRAAEGSPLTLPAPGETGQWEVRYVLEEGRRTMGRTLVETTSASVDVQAPDTAPAGSNVAIRWNETVSENDFITLVPVDAEADAVSTHERASAGSPVELRTPGAPGLYEARYVLEEGRKLLGSSRIELTEPEVALEATQTTLAGSTVEITWEGTVSKNDLITIIPADAEADAVSTHERASAGSPVELRAPGEPGLYEARYVLESGRRPLARAPVELTEPSVSIEAPSSVAPGDRLKIRWEGTVSEHDFITIVPADAEDGAVATHERAGAGSPLTLRAPEQPGVYEVRYVLESGRRTLTRSRVQVSE